jgi:hypothetical protein
MIPKLKEEVEEYFSQARKLHIDKILYADIKRQELWIYLGSSTNTVGFMEYELDLSFLVVYKVETGKFLLKQQVKVRVRTNSLGLSGVPAMVTVRFANKHSE